jgi:hypothetical protein
MCDSRDDDPTAVSRAFVLTIRGREELKHGVTRMKIAAFVIALGGTVLPLLAQETVKVHLVEVPVTVIDHDGNPIRGLKAENFELFDDGKRQKITAFDAIDFASTESVSAISPLNPNARRSFILVFDLEYSQHTNRSRAPGSRPGSSLLRELTRSLLSSALDMDELRDRRHARFVENENHVVPRRCDIRVWRRCDLERVAGRLERELDQPLLHVE